MVPFVNGPTVYCLCSITFFVICHAGWSVPDDLEEIKNLHMDAQSGVLLLKLRAQYVVQLLVNICNRGADSAANLKPLFEVLQNDKTARSMLRDLDTCLLSFDSMCLGWTSALNDILNTGTFNIGDVLSRNKIKPVTATSLQLLGSSHGDGDDADEDMDPNQPLVLSMKDLLEFGSAESKIPTADTLALLQLHLQSNILSVACELEASWRDKIMVCIQPPSDDATTTSRRGQGRGLPKPEILFKLDKDAEVLPAAFDPKLSLYRLPSDLVLPFTGSVGSLSDCCWLWKTLYNS